MNKMTQTLLALLVLTPVFSRAETMETAFDSAVTAMTANVRVVSSRFDKRQAPARPASFSGRWLLANKDFPEGILASDGRPAFTLVVDGGKGSVEFVSLSNIPGWMADTNYGLTVKDGVASFASHHYCTTRADDNVSCRLVDARHLSCSQLEGWSSTDGQGVVKLDFVLSPSR